MAPAPVPGQGGGRRRLYRVSRRTGLYRALPLRTGLFPLSQLGVGADCRLCLRGRAGFDAVVRRQEGAKFFPGHCRNTGRCRLRRNCQRCARAGAGGRPSFGGTGACHRALGSAAFRHLAVLAFGEGRASAIRAPPGTFFNPAVDMWRCARRTASMPKAQASS